MKELRKKKISWKVFLEETPTPIRNLFFMIFVRRVDRGVRGQGQLQTVDFSTSYYEWIFFYFQPYVKHRNMLASTNFYQKVTKIVGATLRKVTFSFFPLEFFSPLACYYSNILSVFHQNEIKNYGSKANSFLLLVLFFFIFYVTLSTCN